MARRSFQEARLREHRAVKLRLAGKSYQEIADTPIEPGAEETLYGSAGAAHDAISRVIKAELVEFGQDLDELRAEVIARYNLALQAATKKMADGGKEVLPAIDRILKIEAERRQIISGLAAPRKIEMYVSADDQTAAALAALAELRAAKHEVEEQVEASE